MAIYRFELGGGIGRGTHPVDLEMRSPGEARHEAVLFLAQMLHDRVEEFWTVGEASVTVKDGDGLILFTLDVTALAAPAMPSFN